MLCKGLKPGPTVSQGSVVATRSAEAVLLEDAAAPCHRPLQRPRVESRSCLVNIFSNIDGQVQFSFLS